jgi:hypothetical protein
MLPEFGNMDMETAVISIRPAPVRARAAQAAIAAGPTKPGPVRPAVAAAAPPGNLCPLCRGRLKIAAVNISRCTNIGGPWNTSLECSNPACRFAELSIKTLNEWRTNR